MRAWWMRRTFEGQMVIAFLVLVTLVGGSLAGFYHWNKAREIAQVEVGQVWGFTVEHNPWVSDTMVVRVLEIRDGWVRYHVLGTKNVQMYKLTEKFVQMYERRK